VYLTHTAAATVPVGTAIPWSIEQQNIGDMTVGGLGSSAVTIATGGVYRVTFGVTASGPSSIDVAKNNVAQQVFGVEAAGQNNGSVLLRLNAGDIVAVRVAAGEEGGPLTLAATAGGSAAIVNAWMIVEQLPDTPATTVAPG
jgi:hypothetical protein